MNKVDYEYTYQNPLSRFSGIEVTNMWITVKGSGEFIGFSEAEAVVVRDDGQYVTIPIHSMKRRLERLEAND